MQNCSFLAANLSISPIWRGKTALLQVFADYRGWREEKTAFSQEF
jgi:hypothetical protein